MGLSSASPRLPVQFHTVAWDDSLRSISVLLPHIMKQGDCIDLIVLTCEDFTSAAGHSADVSRTSPRERMCPEPTENSHTVFGIHWVGYDKCCLRSWD